MTTIREYMELNDKGSRDHLSELTQALMEEPTIQRWMEKIKQRSKTGHSKRTRGNALNGIKKFIQFLASGPDENLTLTLDILVESGKTEEGEEKLTALMRDAFNWLKGEEIEEYDLVLQTITHNSAHTVIYSQLRGFFARNRVVFSDIRPPAKHRGGESRLTDEQVELIHKDVNGRTRLNLKEYHNFFKKLALTERAFVACQLSLGGINPVDLLKITIGYVKSETNYYKRCLIYRGSRQKTTVEFEGFINGVAVQLLKHYIDVERSGAADNERVFMTKESNGKLVNISPKVVEQRIRNVAISLGWSNGGNNQHPWCCARNRRIFNKIARDNNIPDIYLKRWQGHKYNVSEGYGGREIGLADSFEQFKKIRDLISVYRTKDADDFIEPNVAEELQAENVKLKDRLDLLEGKLERLYEGLSADLALQRVGVDRQQLAEDSQRAGEFQQMAQAERERLERERTQQTDEEE